MNAPQLPLRDHYNAMTRQACAEAESLSLAAQLVAGRLPRLSHRLGHVWLRTAGCANALDMAVPAPIRDEPEGY